MTQVAPPAGWRKATAGRRPAFNLTRQGGQVAATSRRRRWRAPTAITFMVACAASCGDTKGGSGSPVLRDSAGIRIVENSAAAWGDAEQWRIDDRPLVSIGAADGPAEYQFHLIVGAHRMGDGTIVVVNRGTNDIRYFTSQGDFLQRVGGTGAGPGEFNLLYRSYLLHDTLFAYDAGLRRMTAFDADGRLVRTFGMRRFSAVRLWNR